MGLLKQSEITKVSEFNQKEAAKETASVSGDTLPYTDRQRVFFICARLQGKDCLTGKDVMGRSDDKKRGKRYAYG